jgi:hypothetical protein
MKKTRFTEAQIVSILHQQEAGKSVKDTLAKIDNDDLLVVAYTSEGDQVVDISVEKIYLTDESGRYDKVRRQTYYDVEVSQGLYQALLISVEPPKRER